jgi:hypothetical protein
VHSRIASVAAIIALICLAFGGRSARAATVAVDAPPSLAAAAMRVRAFDVARLTEDLARAGLEAPAEIHVTLIPEEDPRAAAVPAWIVGFASRSTQIVIFPERVLPYPYDSIESVLRHEIAHLALSSRAGSRPLPRWFHEGVAVSVDAGWDMSSRLQLLLAMRKGPGLAGLATLFAAGNQPDSALAYRLSAALVADVRRRHGPAVPGAIAARVAGGEDFARAFELETGQAPDAAATQAWAGYRRWTTWVAALTSDSMPWAVILLLAFVAFAVRIRRRAQHRRRWGEEEEEI